MKVKKLKVGHAGTLDPLATGVVVVCTGKATKKIDQLQKGTKEYIATIQLGATTPSFDKETEIDAVYPTDHINRELIERTIPLFVGHILQTPPAFSAVKVDGERAYESARKGIDIQLKPKELYIDQIEIIHFEENELKLRIVCSKGTYIRALARDIGQALESGAHLSSLVRTRVGSATIEECIHPDQFEEFLRQIQIEMPQ